MPNRRHNRPPISYRDSGVDIDAGNALVEAIKPLAASTRRAGAGADLGGFGALFDLKAAGFQDPILVASNDGVGTKLKIAIDTGLHATIGIDLVAMCVNDLLAQGAEPLFFLDYFACGKLDVATARAVIAGIADGCRLAGCALIGGETAEMPGMYGGSDYDLAGFAVGAAERGALLPRSDIAAGDVLIGLPSSGVHSNGYSLVRRLVTEARLAWDAPAQFAPATSLAEALLVPTRIYVRPVLRAIRATGAVKGLAHITGGGLSENLPRILPAGLAAHIDLGAWPSPPVFGWLRQVGNLDDAEMLRTFNCGIGLVAVAARASADDVLSALKAAGETPVLVGEIEPGRGVKSAAKGKGEADAVRYSGKLELADKAPLRLDISAVRYPTWVPNGSLPEMTKTEELSAVAAQLSEEQVDALLQFARSMADEPFYEKAPPEALASLERGLEQIARGETISIDELSSRLAAAAKSSGS